MKRGAISLDLEFRQIHLTARQKYERGARVLRQLEFKDIAQRVREMTKDARELA